MKRQEVKRFITKYFPILLFTFFFIVIFRKVFFNGLYPYPGDLLVSFFFPYNSGGWEGYNSWVAHKEFVAADVVRQLYPWRNLAIDLLKGGALPLWNPYAFSGTPLAANLQTAAFYPINLIFFLLPFFQGWIVYILLQPILAGIGLYLFIRSLSLSRLSSTFAGFAFGFIGYLLIWFELGVVGHTAAWLPFVLWGITKFGETKRLYFLLLSSLFLSLSLLAGHAQTAVYVLLLSALYFVYCINIRKLKNMMHLVIFLSLGIGIAAIQLIPSIELLLHSARNAPESAEIFHRNLLPLSHLVTVFAPDFFGNQTTNNYWGKNYGEFMAYVGIVALTFAMIGVWNHLRDTTVRFFSLTVLVALLFALPGPFSESLLFFHIPVLGTGIPARSLFLACFSLVVLSAYGIESVFLQKKRTIYKPLAVLFGVYILMWLVTIILPMIVSGEEITRHMSVAKRNLILPTVTFLSAAAVAFFVKRFPRMSHVGFFCLFVFASLEYQYFMYKFLPFAPLSYLYPSHPVVSKLQQTAGNDRIFGYETARLETNLPTQWRLKSPEGYDPLYLKQYGELITAGKLQKFSENIPRSDATLPDSLPTNDSEQKQRLLNMLGVKYIVAKDDHPASNWEPNHDRYPEDRFRLIWQESKWKIYENKQAFPRAAVFYTWDIKRSSEEVIKTLFDPKFPYRSALVVEEDPGIEKKNVSPTPVAITEYSADKIVMRTKTEHDGLLFLSDTFYPGWAARVSGKPVPILRANHTFRAVPLPKGSHTVIFDYQPVSFYLGAAVSGISFVTLIILLWQSTKGGVVKHAKHN